MKRLLKTLTVALGVVISGVAHAGTGGFEAYWVFVGAAEGTYQDNVKFAYNVEKAVQRCGYSVAAEPSFKFSNNSDMTFFFVTDYFSPDVHGKSAGAKAKAVLDKVKKCVPDAYMKKTWYSGE